LQKAPRAGKLRRAQETPKTFHERSQSPGTEKEGGASEGLGAAASQQEARAG